MSTNRPHSLVPAWFWFVTGYRGDLEILQLTRLEAWYRPPRWWSWSLPGPVWWAAALRRRRFLRRRAASAACATHGTGLRRCRSGARYDPRLRRPAARLP